MIMTPLKKKNLFIPLKRRKDMEFIGFTYKGGNKDENFEKVYQKYETNCREYK